MFSLPAVLNCCPLLLLLKCFLYMYFSVFITYINNSRPTFTNTCIIVRVVELISLFPVFCFSTLPAFHWCITLLVYTVMQSGKQEGNYRLLESHPNSSPRFYNCKSWLQSYIFSICLINFQHKLCILF